MNELKNTATAVGNYNNISTTLVSNIATVNIVDGLSLVKSADKTSGDLMYTITINNETENNYEKPVITDIIDTSLVTFIDGSVTIDGTKATSSEYKYDEQTHTLTVNLDTITPSSSSTLTFLVKKKS
jgi:uncharacterized repeat protein (TIGR01451 family)